MEFWNLTGISILVLVFFTSAKSEEISDTLDLAPGTFVLTDSNGADSDSFDKRMSKFMRVGKGLSSFIRIGKNFPQSYLLSDEYKHSLGPITEMGALYPGEKRDPEQEEFEPSLDSFMPVDEGVGNEGLHTDKRGSAFIRIGKIPTTSFARAGHQRYLASLKKRPFMRIGRLGHSSFIRIGKRDTNDALAKIQRENEDYYMLDGDDKRASRFMRIGKADNGENGNKRASRFMRIGKNYDSELDKKASRFMRIGKNYDPEFNKKASRFMRIGKSDENEKLKDKKASRFMRIGKSQDEVKRTSRFMRIGKSSDDKRTSRFMRIGKAGDLNKLESIDNNLGEETLDDRTNRDIGDVKRASRFMRIGKSDENETV